MIIKELFDKPKIIGIVADINQGKSNLIYYLVEELKKQGTFNLYTYGLKIKIKEAKNINSINEMETIEGSVLIIDEMFSLFDLDNTRIKAQLEKTFRLINHNNNILVLCGVGENYKKFLSSKLDIIIYKKINFYDLINGSRVKNTALNYRGQEAGNTLLNLSVDEALIFNGKNYNKIIVPYQKEYDSKLKNKPIISLFIKKKISETKSATARR